MAGDLPTLPPLRDVIRQHDLQARKSLGQNFLLDQNLTRRIARAAGPLEGATVVEVGPGPGGLTRALLIEGASRVIAVEKDPRCVAALAELAQAFPGRLEVIEGDATRLQVEERLGPGPARIVANLPYNVGTLLLVNWLSSERWPSWWDSLTLMFQKEVALRLVASPGSKDYGRLSVLAQWRSRPGILFDVDRRAFTPPPKITSSVVQIRPGEMPAGVEPTALAAVTAAAFGQRRKMLRSSLKSATPDAERILETAGIPPTARAEEVDVSGFLRLTRAYQALRGPK
ncbi:16S rRNA (adenine(1518)-N(6)/adenine(1519)-N(6))-dimethyltransferase RsmA [Lutibaculum baratangense]|uniref:Ribosomal RNA small subunit methyltransferase A n=1 Tax=Lutibaculum baratangense AMV1 TaxID=631454 RepID=V4RPL9_9HYPH|nr:16S rRNA (adenine(1518)-N(6)/adenine(1519)-N(6))-dimethyltransferase RsmA [Lutibaculum baratangense]ESR27229.1 Dimethyladenosine transferase [Lutibaculum baratangense AMV1]